MAMLLCQHRDIVWLLILFVAMSIAATPCDSAFGLGSRPKPCYHHDPGTPPKPEQNLHPKDPYSWGDASSTEEIAIIQRATDTLKAYDHKSDCFKEAARTLRQNCKSIDIDLDEKTKYAIRLTACEVATANMAVPLECRNIISLNESSDQKDNEMANSDIGRCLESLGLVPQLWTSYSGYFREVKAMCLAVRYSIEHENFHNLQRNMTRYHAEQTALLRKHQREILETHQLETEMLHEILNLHSKVIREVKSVELIISSLQHSLATIFDNISSQNERVVQQSVELSNLHEQDKRIFSERQTDLETAFASISMTIGAWHELLQTDISSSYELNRLSQSLIAKINESNDGLEIIIDHVDAAKQDLESLAEATIECIRSLLGLYNAGTNDIKVSTQAALTDLLGTLDTLETSGIAAWRNMMEGLKAEGGQFRQELSVILEGATSNIQNLASTSQEQIRQLNQLINEFEVRQGGFLWQLQIIHQIWGFLADIAPKSASKVSVAMTSIIFVVTTLVKGTRVALLLLARSTAVYVGCKKLLGSVPFLYIVVGTILVNFCVSSSRYRHRPCGLLDAQGQGCRTLRHGPMQDYLVQLNGSAIKHLDEFDILDGLDSRCPPPYDDYEARSSSKRFAIQERAISSQSNPIYKTSDSPVDLEGDGLSAWNETFNLSLGSCTEDIYH